LAGYTKPGDDLVLVHKRALPIVRLERPTTTSQSSKSLAPQDFVALAFGPKCSLWKGKARADWRLASPARGKCAGLLEKIRGKNFYTPRASTARHFHRLGETRSTHSTQLPHAKPVDERFTTLQKVHRTGEGFFDPQEVGPLGGGPLDPLANAALKTDWCRRWQPKTQRELKTRERQSVDPPKKQGVSRVARQGATIYGATEDRMA
jgi:hypothetical protein